MSGEGDWQSKGRGAGQKRRGQPGEQSSQVQPQQQQQRMGPRAPNPGTQMRPQHPGAQMRPQQPGTQMRPQQPGAQMRPQHQGTQMRPQHPGAQMRPQQPGAQMRPQHPGAHQQQMGDQQRPFQRSGPPYQRPMSQVTGQMAQMSLADKDPGKTVQLISNLFRILIKSGPKIPIFKYTLDVIMVEDDKSVPRKIPKHLRLAAIDKMINGWLQNNKPQQSMYVPDSNGSTIITLFEMQAVPFSCEVLIPDNFIRENKLVTEDKKFTVKFSSCDSLNLKNLVDNFIKNSLKDFDLSQEILRVINILMNGTVIQNPSYLVSQSKSTSAIYSLKERFDLNPGVECFRGVALAPRAIQAGCLALNIANTVAPFYRNESLITIISDRFGLYKFDITKKLRPDQLDMLNRDFKNVQVEMYLRNFGTKDKPHYRKYRIQSIGGDVTDKFECKDLKTGKSESISIKEYFKREYRYDLKHPNLPCIISNGRKVPLEVCLLEGRQRVIRKMKPDETSKVIKEAALKPDVYFKRVQEKADMLSKNPTLEKFGLELECKPIEVGGRELPPIEICIGRNFSSSRNGQYDLRDKYLLPAKINKWALIALRDRNTDDPGFMQSIQTFNERYCRQMRMRGIEIAQLGRVFMVPEKQTGRMPDEQTIKTEFKKTFVALNEEKFDFGMILLPSGMDWLYGYIQYLETLPDVLKSRKNAEKCTRTACVKFDNYRRKILGDPRDSEMFLSNLALKHNVKMGGVNAVLKQGQKFGLKKLSPDFLADGYLIISIDVCHPAPGDKFMQSVAAMVGMWDITSEKLAHSTRLRVQMKQKQDDKSTVEKVLEVGDMFQSIIKKYIEKKKKPPTHIVILRDGVSQGQFEMVVKYEIQKIKGVIEKFAKGAKMSCFTVQKRHKVRFMLKQPIENRGRMDYNIQPGTVVDNTVVHPNMPNFFLAPHKAIQGTAIPPHVFMLWNEIGFDKDTAQAMIHALSYLSPRCTKGTSIPTPVNLADLAAERGKNIIIAWASDKDPKKVMKEEEYLPQLNAHLAKLGDSNYNETLYYI